MKELTYEQALNRAAALCSRAEKCATDIANKAAEWGLEKEETARLLEYLKKERFIDEARYAHAFAHDKYEYQHWGRVKIRCALLQKQISAGIVDNALNEVVGPDGYMETLVELLRARMQGMQLPLPQKERAKLYRFAAQRGYEMGMIGKALQQLNVPDEE